MHTAMPVLGMSSGTGADDMAVLITIQLPDGTYAQKPIDALQPDDQIVFGGRPLPEYRPQKMDWDFDDGSLPPPGAKIVYVGGFDL